MNQNKQTQRNFIYNLINLIVNLGIGLFYTPYLVKSLGIIAYGIVPLALIINQYINVITGSLTGALTRFYSVALQKNNFNDASKYLSSSFVSLSAIVILLSPVFIWIIVKLNWIFNIPTKYIFEARILFTFTIISFILSLYSSLLNITLYALNRLDSLNVIKILRIGIKFLLTVSFFEAITKSISYIGYANFFTELLVIILSFFYFIRTTTDKIKISVKLFEKTALISVLAMTTWVMVHQIGDTGLYRIDNILVNKFWSTRESGILGALSDFGNYVMAIIIVISSLFGPLILIAYSQEDHEKVKKLALQNSLYIGLLTSLIVGTLIGFAKPIITLWLGKDFAIYSNWFILKQITLPFYAAAGVLAFTYRAWNKVVMPAIITVLIGFINFIISTFVCYISNGNEGFILYMLLVSVFFIISQSYGLNALIFCQLYPEVPKLRLFMEFLLILFILLITSILGLFYTYILFTTTVIQLLFGLTFVFVISSIFVFLIIIKHSEKRLLINYLFSIIKINSKS